MRSVEVHCARVYAKLGVRSAAAVSRDAAGGMRYPVSTFRGFKRRLGSAKLSQ